jgi:glutamyl-tRNA synthetase
MAAQRAREAGGTLVFRNDDLDSARCKPEYSAAAVEDLRWLGLAWSEGPDCGGRFAPYAQSERTALYRLALEALHKAGLIFPCTRSRRDVLEAAGAPHEGGMDDEPVYPPEFRPAADAALPPLGDRVSMNWRFRVPDGEEISFTDRACGLQRAIAGLDFGDFIVWRKDNTPSYQLACVVDDSAMRISEVVRGEDLIRSTFRQILLYRALRLKIPAFYHCPLVTDENGVRLAKRHDALSLRTLREQGRSPADIVARFASSAPPAA